MAFRKITVGSNLILLSIILMQLLGANGQTACKAGYTGWYLRGSIFTGHCYYLSTSFRPWLAARDACRALDPDARLVGLETTSEFNWLTWLIGALGKTGNHYWVGAGQSNSVYYWVDPLPPKFSWTKMTIPSTMWCNSDAEPEYTGISNRAVYLSKCGWEGVDLKTHPYTFWKRYICEIKRSKLGPSSPAYDPVDRVAITSG